MIAEYPHQLVSDVSLFANSKFRALFGGSRQFVTSRREGVVVQTPIASERDGGRTFDGASVTTYDHIHECARVMFTSRHGYPADRNAT